jgi:hypothetical protein
MTEIAALRQPIGSLRRHELWSARCIVTKWVPAKFGAATCLLNCGRSSLFKHVFGGLPAQGPFSNHIHDLNYLFRYHTLPTVHLCLSTSSTGLAFKINRKAGQQLSYIYPTCVIICDEQEHFIPNYVLLQNHLHVHAHEISMRSSCCTPFAYS